MRRAIWSAVHRTVATVGISDWASLMTAIVPSDVATAPTCPSGGTYTWVQGTAYCSVHGSYHTP